MSNNLFPSLPGMTATPVRSQRYKTTVHTTASGKEQRTSWQSAPRRRFKVTFDVLRDNVNAPAPYGAFTEIGVVWSFHDTHRGSFDSWLMPDPYTGSNIRVRFVDDSLETTQVVHGVWNCTFEVIEVP
jgi:hypothetical protein